MFYCGLDSAVHSKHIDALGVFFLKSFFFLAVFLCISGLFFLVVSLIFFF